MKTMPEVNQPTQTPQGLPTATQSPSVSKKTLNIIAAATGILIILGIAGYFVQQQTGDLFEKVGKLGILKDNTKTTVETNQGKTIVGKSEVPSGFPSDISIYKGATVTESVESELGISIILETKDSATKVSDFYKADLAKNGWKITETTTISGSFALTAEKGSKRAIVVVAPGKENKTNISISITKK